MTGKVDLWQGGRPTPITEDVAATRAAWEPNIDDWCDAIKRDFASMLDPSVYRGHLGWCDSKKLWRTFWEQLVLQPGDRWLDGFGAYMPWAGAVGNMAYFETMPVDFWPQMQQRFDALDLIVHPSVVVWYEQQCVEFVGNIRAGQLAMWDGIEWMGNQYRSLGQARSGKTFAMEEYLDLMASAIEVYAFKKDQQARMLGHLLMGPMPEALRPGVVEVIERKLKHLLALDLNVPLVALCSGYAFHGVQAEATVVADVYSIARQFMGAQQARTHLDNTMLGGGGVAAMMIATLPSFHNWEGLYLGVQALGLFSPHESVALSSPLDGGIFDTYGETLSPS